MILDLHIHTQPGSGDSNIQYNELVPRAREMGLDGICITEHGVEKTGIGEKLAREYDFLVLEGMETSTELGDILIFGLESIPRALYRAADMREYVKKEGGAMIAAHLPKQIGCCVTIFDNDIRSEADLVAELKGGRFRAEDRRLQEQKAPNYWFS